MRLDKYLKVSRIIKRLSLIHIQMCIRDRVIPSRSLREFSAVFTDDIETVEIFFANNQILFRSENISFYTRLLEGNYPDTDRLIPTDFNTTITFDVVNLRQSMERARLLSSATQNGTVKLEIKGGVVSAHVHSPEVGKVNEEIDTEHVTGDDLTISFNPTYLIDSLKALNRDVYKRQKYQCNNFFKYKN